MALAASAPPAAAQGARQTSPAHILAASYDQPTTRYPHGALGDPVEHGTLRLSLSNGRELHLILPETLVFEDEAPRLADLDGDGRPEVITVESHAHRGARLAIWDETGRITATAFIGRRFRWLAPLGAADLDGDGRVEIAYVDRPHLAKTLHVLRYDNRALHPVARLHEVSNHQFGWSHIPGGIRHCKGRAEMILASGDWTRLLSVRLTGEGALHQSDLGPYEGPRQMDAALGCG